MSRVKAGVLASILSVVFVYFAWTGANPFVNPYQIKAVFQGAPELHSRTPVRIAGVEAGRITKVEQGPGNAVTVTMELEEGARPIHRDATAKVRTRLFLEGNFFVDLRPGTPNAPELDEDGVIPLSHTAVPVQLDEIISEFRSDTRQDLRTFVGELAAAFDAGGAEALGATVPELAPTFRNLAQVSEATRGNEDGDLAGAIRYSERTARAIDSREAALPELVTGLNRTTRALASRRAELEASLPELDGLLREARPALAEVRRLAPPARAFVSEIRPGLRAAPATLRLASPFLSQLDSLVSKVPALSDQADPALGALARLEPGLRRVLDLATPVTECLRRNAIPTLKTPVDDPPHSTGDPVYLDLAHSLVGQASASQNFDGNGPSIRYHSGFGTQMVSLRPVTDVLNQVIAAASEEIVGSRPRRPAQQPPFRPDVPCVGQERPDLRAETGPAPLQARARGARSKGPPLTARGLGDRVLRATEALREGLR